MRVFQFVAVRPLPALHGYDLPKLEHSVFIVGARSMSDALDTIRGYGSVIEAAEVWGAELVDMDVLVLPGMKTCYVDTLIRHQDWQAAQTTFKLLQRGVESIDQFFKREFINRYSPKEAA